MNLFSLEFHFKNKEQADTFFYILFKIKTTEHIFIGKEYIYDVSEYVYQRN